MVADGLATQGARPSETLVLSWFVRNIPVSAPEGSTPWYMNNMNDICRQCAIFKETVYLLVTFLLFRIYDKPLAQPMLKSLLCLYASRRLNMITLCLSSHFYCSKYINSLSPVLSLYSVVMICTYWWLALSFPTISVQNLFWISSGHYDDVIMTMLASQITSLTVVYSIVYSGVNQRKHQSSASLAFVREIHRGPMNFPHKWPVTRKMFPFDDVIMRTRKQQWTYVIYGLIVAGNTQGRIQDSKLGVAQMDW